MSSLDNALGGITSLSNQVQSGLNTVTRVGADLGLGGVGGSQSYWMDRLRDASFRGVPFVMQVGDSAFGRRNVVHEYPFRDKVWVEDLGRSARRIDVQGFLVGDDCIAQRDAMVAACERADEDDSVLIHPTYGQLRVTLLGKLKVTERWDKGRMFELAFSFIESGQREFPGTDEATGNAVDTQASAADAACASDFIGKTAGALKSGAAVVQQAVSVTNGWIATAQRLSNDATSLRNLVSTLGGAFGRFANGRNVGGLSAKSTVNTKPSSVASLVALGSVARTSVAASASALTASAAGLSASTASTFATSAQALAASVAASAADPADAVRLMGSLAALAPYGAVPSSPIGLSMQQMQAATGDLLRRAAVTAMARATTTYQPSSVDDAAALRLFVCAALDAEITAAGDQGADDSYNALRGLRTAVVADLTRRGAGLPSKITISSSLPLPSLVLAHRQYRDSGRADELVTQSNCIHPAFMPTRFAALSK